MADFTWLDRIADANWNPHGNGFIKSIELNKFLSLSSASPNTWRDEFDAWGQEQPRQYQQFWGPNSHDGCQLAWIVCGQWDTGHALPDDTAIGG